MRRSFIAAVAVILFLLISHSWLFAGISYSINDSDGTRENPYRIPRTNSPVRIDGELNEDAWKNAFVLELKYEVSPGINIEAPVKTEVLLTYDDSTLYAAFRAFDTDPDSIRAYLHDRDSAWSDDWVAIVIDTFNDERRDYLIGCNSLGVQMDTIEINFPEQNSEWDGIWDSAGRIQEWGYSVEIAIPFDQLRFQRSEGDQIWGFDAVRNYPRSVNHFMGSFPRDRNNNCYLCQATKIKGFAGIDPGRNIEIVPTLTAARTDERSELPDSDFEEQNQDAEVGVSAKWGITPNITFNATANPDFSQVEADARQLDINRTFALFYPEKRPFFTEGADYFETLINVIHTRTMRAPEWGFKLTGKEGANTVGAYVVRDEFTNLLIPGVQSSRSTSLASANYSTVLRYKRDIGNQYNVGGFFTNRQADDYFNRVFGIDGRFRITDRDRISVEFIGSSTRYPDEMAQQYNQPQDDFTGTAYAIDYFHDAKDLTWVVRYWGFSDDFRSDLGFSPRIGYRWLSGWMDYYWYADAGKWWSTINVGGGFDYTTDTNGDLLYRTQNAWLDFSGAMQSSINLRGEFNLKEVYNGQEFDNSGFRIRGSIRPVTQVYLSGNFFIGNDIDYSNTRQADRLSIKPGINLNLGRHIQLNYSHNYEKLSVESGRLYTANISETRLIYQFDKRALIRAILQYVDYRRNTEVYTFEIDPVFKSLFTQFLFSYKLNPRTVLFIGYSDNYYGNQDFSLEQNDRTVFVKLGYSWTL